MKDGFSHVWMVIWTAWQAERTTSGPGSRRLRNASKADLLVVINNSINQLEFGDHDR
jgi:hypothetical protein